MICSRGKKWFRVGSKDLGSLRNEFDPLSPTLTQWHFCSKFHPNLYKSSHGNVWGVERSRKDQGTGICCQIALFFSQNWIIFEKRSKMNKNLGKTQIYRGFSTFFPLWLKNSADWQQIWVPWDISLLLTSKTSQRED